MVYDYIVIGSGFGGSVAGLHLVEKGYKVLILEQGKRYNPEDFPKTNWNIPKYISIPELGFFGFKKLSIYCDNPEKSDDFARVISSGNVHILNGLMKNGQIVTGGTINAETRYVAPTIIKDVKPHDPIMQQSTRLSCR